MASSETRPAIRADAADAATGDPAGDPAACHRARNASTSPSMASTSSSSTPQDGSRGEEKTAETVVWTAAGLAGQDPQARPTGPVMQAVQRVDEVPVRTRRQVRPWQGAHVASPPNGRPRVILLSILGDRAACPRP